MKILGILGGMGPWATSHFFHEILRWTEAKKDWDHLRIIIDNNVSIPSRTRAILYNEESPTKAIQSACFNLINAGCDYIAVPCNSAHYFFDDVVCANNIPWVNMIEVIANKLKSFKRVLVLGGYITIIKKTYDKYLNNTIYLSNNKVVYEAIESAKLNNFMNLHNLYDKINNTNADCVLLGCTELPIVVESNSINSRVIDGNEIYIKELIKICGGKIKGE